jgi:putative hydrolase of the HAD superfamily
MSETIEGVAFDLDGTFYPNYRFYIRLLPFILKEHKLLWALGKARTMLRESPPPLPPACGFYECQARVMAGLLGAEPAVIQERIERLIYRGWEPLFKKIRMFPHVKETLSALKAGGLKLGLLSDFPPEAKLANLGLGGRAGPLWDSVLCSELTCRLKPDRTPFMELARQMGLAPERILYVGNSVVYDIAGAKRAGLQAALVCPPLAVLNRKRGGADFVFSDYRQLRKFVLNW